MPEETYTPGHSAELLKQEIERLQSEQQEEIDDAIYLGLTSERAEKLKRRRARIKALRDNLDRPDEVGTRRGK